jgi:hypothetical protein
MREVPSEVQGDLLEAMQDILKNLNDALEGPEIEYERWYKLSELFPLGNCRPSSEGHHRRNSRPQAQEGFTRRCLGILRWGNIRRQ